VMATYQYRCSECDSRVAALLVRMARVGAEGGGRGESWRPPTCIRTEPGLARHRLREEASQDVLVVAAAAPAARRRPTSVLRPATLPLP
jgi:hypothetical protein